MINDPFRVFIKVKGDMLRKICCFKTIFRNATLVLFFLGREVYHICRNFTIIHLEINFSILIFFIFVIFLSFARGFRWFFPELLFSFVVCTFKIYKLPCKKKCFPGDETRNQKFIEYLLIFTPFYCLLEQ